MRFLRCIALLLGFAAAASAATPEIVAVKTGRLIDPKAGVVVPGAIILIENGKVQAVGPSVGIPAGAKVIDLSTMTVLPGLMDCHTHLVGDYVNDADPLTELRTSSAQRAFESFPTHG
jgi:imidazolonepropionase-like amidohydrolase